MRLEIKKKARWHTVVYFRSDQQREILGPAIVLADITRRDVRILDGAGRLKAHYQPA